jgi:hypothetical protein
MNMENGTMAAAIPCLGIFVSNFRYWFFAVQGWTYSVSAVVSSIVAGVMAL